MIRLKPTRRFLVAILAILGAALASTAGDVPSWGPMSARLVARLSALPSPIPELDKAAYDAKLLEIAHVAPPASLSVLSASGSISESALTASSAMASSRPALARAASSGHASDLLLASGSVRALPAIRRLWPVKTVYPDAGALLPFNRIIAFYGNFYSKSMGILGQYPPEVVLSKLRSTARQWRMADPRTPVIPAIDYIVESAQGYPGSDGMYRLRMPDSQVGKALAMADKVHGLLFLDFQVGWSTVQRELPRYAKYLTLPNVNVSLDPEFSMKVHLPPGRRIGTLDATDINWVGRYMARVVRAHHLPPKVLVVFRFTHDMVTHYKRIRPLPEVQVVVDMDGWGTRRKKIGTYRSVIYPDPVQFTGFKLFYKNDLRPPSRGMLTPAQVLALTPAPSYIQYQ